MLEEEEKEKEEEDGIVVLASSGEHEQNQPVGVSKGQSQCPDSHMFWADQVSSRLPCRCRLR